jgi:aspartokinase
MVTVSHLVKKYLDEHSMVQDALEEGILSNAALAEKIQKPLERELGKKIMLPAIVMALRRAHEKIESHEKKHFKPLFAKELLMKTNLVDITVLKSRELYQILHKIYKSVEYEKGDTLNIIHGNYEISIITNEKHSKKFLKLVKKERIIAVEKNLVSLSLTYPKEFVSSLGVIAKITKKLAWENVNIIEIVSTTTELAVIVKEKDTLNAYHALQDFIKHS